MSVEFVVEDGTGKATATSYVTVAEFEQYWENRGVTFTETDAVIETWLNIATEFIDEYYRFFGYATNYETQALQWPRTGLRDNKGNLIDDDTIPTQLKNAVFWAARDAKNQVDLSSKIDTGIKSKRIGPVSVTYKDGYIFEYKNINKFLHGLCTNNLALRATT